MNPIVYIPSFFCKGAIPLSIYDARARLRVLEVYARRYRDKDASIHAEIAYLQYEIPIAIHRTMLNT